MSDERITKLERDVALLIRHYEEGSSLKFNERLVRLETIVESTVEEIKTNLSVGLANLQEEVTSQRAMQKGFLWTVGGLFALVQAWPVLKEMFKALLV